MKRKNVDSAVVKVKKKKSAAEETKVCILPTLLEIGPIFKICFVKFLSIHTE